MRCAEIKRVLSDIFLFKNLNEVSASFWTFETIFPMMGKVLIHIYIYINVCVHMCWYTIEMKYLYRPFAGVFAYM